VIAVDLLW